METGGIEGASEAAQAEAALAQSWLMRATETAEKESCLEL